MHHFKASCIFVKKTNSFKLIDLYASTVSLIGFQVQKISTILLYLIASKTHKHIRPSHPQISAWNIMKKNDLIAHQMSLKLHPSWQSSKQISFQAFITNL